MSEPIYIYQNSTESKIVQSWPSVINPGDYRNTGIRNEMLQ